MLEDGLHSASLVERDIWTGLPRVTRHQDAACGPFELRTAKWFRQTLRVCCPKCGEMSRAFFLFVDPETEVRMSTDAVWRTLERYAFLTTLRRADAASGGMLISLSNGLAALANLELRQHCEQCRTAIAFGDFQAAAMEAFSSDARQEPAVEMIWPMTARSATAVLFHEDLAIQQRSAQREGYGRMVRLSISDSEGELAIADVFHHVEHGDFALTVLDGSGRETMAFGFEARIFTSIRQLVNFVLAMGYAVEEVAEISAESILARLSALMAISALKGAGYEIETDNRRSVDAIRRQIEAELAAL